jgi:FMN reductase
MRSSWRSNSGASTRLFGGPSLVLPMYNPAEAGRDPRASDLIAAPRPATGIIIASAAYHGSISGLLKNALDYTEDMRGDAAPYLDRRAVGVIACAVGWQAATTSLVALRSIVHALRGWNVPLGVAVNTTQQTFDGAVCVNRELDESLKIMVRQVVSFAASPPPNVLRLSPLQP